MATETSTWVWYDSSVIHPLARTAGKTAFENSIIAEGVDLSTYRDATWVDQNSNNSVADLDFYNQNGSGEPTSHEMTPPAGEGLRIDGTVQQMSTFMVMNATLQLDDTSAPRSVRVNAYQLKDGSVAYHLRDSDIQSLINDGYARYDVESVTLTSPHDYFIAVGPAGHDDAFPCFVAGTLVETAAGPVRVEELSRGDLVKTQDRGCRPVVWVGKRIVVTAGCDWLKPVLIRKGALGDGVPARDLRVSQQHRMLVRSRIARRMFDAEEVLVAAKHLLGNEGISLDERRDEVTYVHFMCEDHEIVWAEGAPTESLYLGPEAQKILGQQTLDEIFGIFPELRGYVAEPARALIKGPHGRKLVERHRKNGRPLLSV